MKALFAVRCEIEPPVFLDQRRQHELRAHYSSNTKRGSEIVVIVAQLDVIAEVRNIVAHEAFDRFAFGAHLERALRIGSNRHIEMRHGVERKSRAAGAELHQRSRLRALRGIVDFAEKIRQSLHRILGALVVMGGVVTGRNAVHVLAVELETVKSPIDKNLAHQLLCDTPRRAELAGQR